MSLAKNVDIFDPDVQRQFETRLLLDFLGTALVVKDAYHPGYQFVDDFNGNHTFRIPLTDTLSYEYLIAAGWNEGSVNNTPDEFKTYVITTARKYQHPVEIMKLSLEKKK